jgi:hypothetical protein
MQARSQSRSGLGAIQRMRCCRSIAPRSFDFAYPEPADLAGYIGGTTPFPPTTNASRAGITNKCRPSSSTRSQLW